MLLVLKAWDRGNSVGFCKVQISLWNNPFIQVAPTAAAVICTGKGQEARRSDRPYFFFLVFSSASRYEVLKGISLLAGLIHGDEAGAGLMQVVLETEPCEASLWWERGKFIPAVQEHLVMHPLVQFCTSRLCAFTQERGFAPLTQKLEGLRPFFELWPFAKRREPRTVTICWVWPSRSRASGASLGAASHTLNLESAGVQPLQGWGLGRLGICFPCSGLWALGLFLPPGCSATGTKYVLSDF